MTEHAEENTYNNRRSSRTIRWIVMGGWGPCFVAAFYIVACVLFLPASIITLEAGFLFGPVIGTITVEPAPIF